MPPEDARITAPERIKLTWIPRGSTYPLQGVPEELVPYAAGRRYALLDASSVARDALGWPSCSKRRETRSASLESGGCWSSARPAKS